MNLSALFFTRQREPSITLSTDNAVMCRFCDLRLTKCYWGSISRRVKFKLNHSGTQARRCIDDRNDPVTIREFNRYPPASRTIGGTVCYLSSGRSISPDNLGTLSLTRPTDCASGRRHGNLDPHTQPASYKADETINGVKQAVLASLLDRQRCPM